MGIKSWFSMVQQAWTGEKWEGTVVSLTLYPEIMWLLASGKFNRKYSKWDKTRIDGVPQ